MPRADQVIVEQGKAASRALAQKLIKAGVVEYRLGSAWLAVSKASQKLPTGSELRIAPSEVTRFVSRGGLKLQGALAHTGVNLAQKSVLDVGQSTGGFSDCAAQAGARCVIGIDSGHDQLHDSLTNHPDIVCLERINARNLPAQQLLDHNQNCPFEAVIMDLSFISQTKVLASVATVMASGADMLALVKPQFELDREHIGKGGLVKDAASYAAVESRIRANYIDNGFNVIDYFDSPIAGGDGNREFFIYARRQ